MHLLQTWMVGDTHLEEAPLYSRPQASTLLRLSIPGARHPPFIAFLRHSYATPTRRASESPSAKVTAAQTIHGWNSYFYGWVTSPMVHHPMESRRVRSRRRSACLRATGFTSSKATWHSPTRKLREGSSTATSLSRVAPRRSPCGTAPRRPSPQKREPNSWLFSSAPGGMSGGH